MIFNKHVLETNVSLHLNTLMMHYINISFFFYIIYAIFLEQLYFEFLHAILIYKSFSSFISQRHIKQNRNRNARLYARYSLNQAYNAD